MLDGNVFFKYIEKDELEKQKSGSKVKALASHSNKKKGRSWGSKKSNMILKSGKNRVRGTGKGSKLKNLQKLQNPKDGVVKELSSRSPSKTNRKLRKKLKK
jgi:hypothetical protein